MISPSSFQRRYKIFFPYNEHKKKIPEYPSVRIHDGIQSGAYAWLDKTFGENWIWSSPIHTDYTDIYFLHSEDALLFKLRFDTIAT